MLQKNKNPMTSIEKGRQYRERQKKLKALQQQSAHLDQNNNQQLVIVNNEQHLSIITPIKNSSTNVIPTSNFSKQNEQQLSNCLLSPSSNISNFNLLHLTNSGHNNHILQPNSSSMEVSEIISSVDIDSDNFILDHNSSSSNVISGNYF